MRNGNYYDERTGDAADGPLLWLSLDRGRRGLLFAPQRGSELRVCCATTPIARRTI